MLPCSLVHRNNWKIYPLLSSRFVSSDIFRCSPGPHACILTAYKHSPSLSCASVCPNRDRGSWVFLDRVLKSSQDVTAVYVCECFCWQWLDNGFYFFPFAFFVSMVFFIFPEEVNWHIKISDCFVLELPGESKDDIHPTFFSVLLSFCLLFVVHHGRWYDVANARPG